MDFTTIVIVAIVAVVAYTLFKAFGKKESVIEAGKEEIAEVKAVETEAVAEVKAVATKAKATVKKATTRKPKAPAKK
jgi:ERCC4-type nuclease